jgi:hypothetical protein
VADASALSIARAVLAAGLAAATRRPEAAVIGLALEFAIPTAVAASRPFGGSRLPDAGDRERHG